MFLLRVQGSGDLDNDLTTLIFDPLRIYFYEYQLFKSRSVCTFLWSRVRVLSRKLIIND